MSFSTCITSPYRDRIRRLKPSKPNSETEYNMQYRSWSMRPFSRDLYRAPIPSARKKSYKSRSNSRYGGSSGYTDSYYSPNSSSHRVSSSCSTISVHKPSVLCEDYCKKRELCSELRTKSATLHQRNLFRAHEDEAQPVQNNVEKKKVSREEKFSKDLNKLNKVLSITEAELPSAPMEKPCSRAGNRREAWGPASNFQNKETRVVYPPEHGVSFQTDSMKMGDICKAIDYLDHYSKENKRTKPLKYPESNSSSHSLMTVSSESSISTKSATTQPCGESNKKIDSECQQKTKSAQTKKVSKSSNKQRLLKPKPSDSVESVEMVDLKKQKVFAVKNMDQMSAEKLYETLTPEELKRLQETYNGLIGTKRDLSKLPPKTTREDLETFRQTAMRATSYPYMSRTSKDWMTSYTDNFRNWETCVRPNVKTLYKAGCTKPGCKVSAEPQTRFTESTFDLQETEIADKEEECKLEDEKEKPVLTFDSQSKFAREERDRLLQEVAEIAEREYNEQYGKDGRAKVEGRTTNNTCYQNWKVTGRDPPVWNNKLATSIGSGHWNLPQNKGNDWKLTEESAQGDANFKPSDCVRPAFKLHVYDPTKEKPLHEAKKIQTTAKSSDPFCALYYPDLKTNSNYLSEYMRKFHAMPIRTKKVRA